MPAFVTTEYVDDLTGVVVDAKNVDTVAFSYRGAEYTLVLTSENGLQFDKDMARYIKAAKKARAQVARAPQAKAGSRAQKATMSRETSASTRKTAAPRKTASARKASAPRNTAAPNAEAKQDGRRRAKAIREWAAANGHAVSERGRISASVVEAYDAAQ